MMDVIDYKAAGFWFGVGQWVFNLIVAVYLVISRKQTATNDRVNDMGSRLHVVEKDIANVKIELDHMPDQHQMERLGRDITNLMQKIGETTGRLDGLNRAVDLMNEFLINQGKR